MMPDRLWSGGDGDGDVGTGGVPKIQRTASGS